MPKKILIVESDTALVGRIRATLEPQGFTVEESSDGKGCVELTRRTKPELLLLAVDLPAGQNGYILCGKFKKDDELRSLPIIIMGNPDGFAAHRKLKSRADEYVGKPLDIPGLVEKIAALVGLPEVAQESLVQSESLDLDSLGMEAEEISVEASSEDTLGGDPALDMLDAAFDDIATPPPPRSSGMPGRNPQPEEPDEVSGRHFVTVDEGGEVSAPGDAFSSAPAQSTNIEASGDAPALSQSRSFSVGPDAAEMRSLRAKVGELQAALEEEQRKAEQANVRTQALQNELDENRTELETARSNSSGGKTDKDFFALRETANKKDKDILKLKSELNEKDQEMVDLRDREVQLEQQLSDVNGETARKDAQLKTASSKLDQTTQEKKQLETQLDSVKQEARAATSQLAAAQADLDQAHGHLGTLETELTQTRDQGLRNQDELKQKLSEAQRTADGRGIELTKLKDSVEGIKGELEGSQNELSSQATAFAEEAERLRRRIGELEDTSQKNEERLAKLYQRIKSDEKVREKTKKAIAIATQLLEEQPVQVETDEGESAAEA